LNCMHNFYSPIHPHTLDQINLEFWSVLWQNSYSGVYFYKVGMKWQIGFSTLHMTKSSLLSVDFGAEVERRLVLAP
jgi:hypothetical protein